MARLLMVLGSSLAVLGMVMGMMDGAALSNVFLVLTAQAGDPAPETQTSLARLTLTTLVFAIGLLMLHRGVRMQARERSPTLGGRAIISLAGIGLVFAGGALFLGMWWLREGFTVLASADVAPSAADVEGFAALAAWPITWSFAVASASLLPLMTLHFNAFWGPMDLNRRAVVGNMALLVFSLAAIAGYAVSLVLACRAGLAVVAMLSAETVSAAHLAAELVLVLRFGMFGAIGLVLIGATQVLTAFTFPKVKPAGT